jgi:hypothetical protein
MSSDTLTKSASNLDEPKNNSSGMDSSALKVSATESVGAEKLGALTRVIRLIFWLATILTAVLVGLFVVSKGLYFGLGALIGGALVVVDVAIFGYFLSKARPGRLTTPLWKTIVKFYLVSLANMLICFVVIKFNLGSPITFLAGLGVFLPALTLGLVFSVFLGSGQKVAKAGQAPAGQKADLAGTAVEAKAKASEGDTKASEG